MSATPTSATILIVDDDQVTREVLVDMLARYNYEILQASNGSDGYQLAIHHHPDLILLDIMMPGMSGFEVCKSLSENPVSCRPVLA
ncbi:MAG: hypothetical protein Fur005_35720 [Roseiflexaceae bacterium]